MIRITNYKRILGITSILIWLPFVYGYCFDTTWNRVEFFVLLLLFVSSIILDLFNIGIAIKIYSEKKIDFKWLILIIALNLAYFPAIKILFHMFVYIT